MRAVGLLSGIGASSGDGTGGGALRADLSGVRLRAGGSLCRVPALAVWSDASGLPPPGDVVEAVGRWRPYASARGLRRPEHRGSLRADRIVTLRDAGGGADTTPAARDRRVASARSEFGGRLRAAAARWRARAAARLEDRLPPDAAALARALTLADRGGLADGTADRFARAGLAHLLAISGLHVGVLAAAAAWLFGLRLRTGRRHVAAAAVTGGYVAWIGAPASAVRAGLLFAGWALARLRGSPIRTSDLLGAAAAAALLADPLILLGPGFQLSFAGFGG